MDFFNTLGEKIKDTSRSVADKAKEMTELTKLNSKISSAESKMKRAYYEIGKMYCDKHTGEIPEEYMPHLEIINSAKMEIEDLNRQMQMLKGYKRCSNCGTHMAQNDVFCRNCGSKNENGPEPGEDEVVDVEKAKEKLCPICKGTVSLDAEYCPTCGEKLVEE